MSFKFNNVVIIGVGLIGGSLGLAGKARGLFGEVVGVGRNRPNLETARRLGAVDRYTHDPRDVCRKADLVVLATPVESIVSIGLEIAPYLRPGAILTDGGSVKETLVSALDAAMPDGIRFVGAHPIAGSEASGAVAARADLFEGARTILTPTEKTDADALKQMHLLWEAVGSEVIEMKTVEHDVILAGVSHLPHVIAYALVSTLADMAKEREDIASYAAGGFKDITRIASSHSEMWVDICKMNKKNMVEMIERYQKVLEDIKLQIQRNQFEKLGQTFADAREFRNKLGPSID